MAYIRPQSRVVAWGSVERAKKRDENIRDTSLRAEQKAESRRKSDHETKLKFRKKLAEEHNKLENRTIRDSNKIYDTTAHSMPEKRLAHYNVNDSEGYEKAANRQMYVERTKNDSFKNRDTSAHYSTQKDRKLVKQQRATRKANDTKRDSEKNRDTSAYYTRKDENHRESVHRIKKILEKNANRW